MTTTNATTSKNRRTAKWTTTDTDSITDAASPEQRTAVRKFIRAANRVLNDIDAERLRDLIETARLALRETRHATGADNAALASTTLALNSLVALAKEYHRHVRRWQRTITLDAADAIATSGETFTTPQQRERAIRSYRHDVETTERPFEHPKLGRRIERASERVADAAEWFVAKLGRVTVKGVAGVPRRPR
ncbi:MAG: hypothetical protein JNM18_15135 [Planctomycetaceae bacterium]|nr:hypothetical protein [Planctomycetaceae bacterium]